MADVPSYSTEYMKRISFLNGQILEDFHLNLMQKNIAETLKLKTTRERYDMYLLVSPYKMYFHEALVDRANQHEYSTAEWNSLSFSFSAGSWETKLLELPQVTDEFCIIGNYEDYPEQQAYVNFYYRTAIDNDWIPIEPDIPVYLSSPTKYAQVKCECVYTGTIRPAVYDFALMWK